MEKEVSYNYQISENEKVESEKYYVLEKKLEKVHFLKAVHDDYECDGPIYSEYTLKNNFKKGEVEQLERTIYYYQKLKKIKEFTIKGVNISISKIQVFVDNKVIYDTSDILKKRKIALGKFYNPSHVKIVIKCFLLQSKKEGIIKIRNQNYVKKDLVITSKGYNTLEIRGMDLLVSLLYDDKIYKGFDLDDSYVKIIKQKKRTYYRSKFYKCFKKKRVISKDILDGYEVIDTLVKYFLYRKERIVLYDKIVLNDYFDLDKVIKESSVPLSRLHFKYVNCHNQVATLKYKDYEVKFPIVFKCQK